MFQRIKASNKAIVPIAVETLTRGGLVVYPTETCYGVGVDATNQQAVDTLLTYKFRREGKPISIAVADETMAKQYAAINPSAHNLYTNFLPGPLTVVSKSTGKTALGIASEYGTIGIRIPDYPLVLDIISEFAKPITATSANMSYRPRPYSIDQLLKYLPKKQQNLIGLIIDGGQLPKNDVSTVVDTTLSDLTIFRKGRISFSEENTAVMHTTTSSSQETEAFGAMVMLKYTASTKRGPLIMALGGELGTGKTHFTKGVAKQLGIKRTITSPSFSLVREYPYHSGKLVHIDTWRLAGTKEMHALDLRQYFTPGTVIVIEWADKFFDMLASLDEPSVTVLKVRLAYVSESKRTISVEEMPATC